MVLIQVAEPLRAMVMGAPLEDARHLAQRYDRMRQEAESQVQLKCLYNFIVTSQERVRVSLVIYYVYASSITSCEVMYFLSQSCRYYEMLISIL